jgi:hypothetical protein
MAAEDSKSAAARRQVANSNKGVDIQVGAQAQTGARAGRDRNVGRGPDGPHAYRCHWRAPA